MDRDTPEGRPGDSSYSGKVLIAGAGFLVTAAAWALLGFVRYDGGEVSVGLLDAVLVAAHLIVGVAILRRVRAAWYAGLAIAALGIAATLLNDYYVPAIPDGISGLLLLLSRDELLAEGRDRPAG